MITEVLARRLADLGLTWQPAPGDRFVVDNPELVEQVLHLADMTIESHQLDTGTIFTFNGTTEWALDSVAKENTLWLPREDQLRQALGDSFRSLSRQGGRWVVDIQVDGDLATATDADVECAYARALIRVLGVAT
ncbi:pilus assembly protein CpaE [Propionibacteriaceae bacterium Y2011]|uniref:pilus assembly protein CpaE n=1 Tax=Microlunatus sp. Y2014 TaxID=3418488 RepID=UPI003B4950EE